METSLTVGDGLPDFVRRQAQAALKCFMSESAPAGQFVGHFQKTGLLIQELRQHPLTEETVTWPMALLRWRDNTWHLYFRGRRGRWKQYPDGGISIRPAPLLTLVYRDKLGIFWRQ